MVEEKKKRNSKWLLLVVAAFFGLPLLCGLYLNWSEDPAEQAVRETRQAAESTAEASEEKDDEDSPTPTQLASEPTATFTARGGLVVAIDGALGESNRGNRRKMTNINYREGEETISVTWAADDNFSSGFIVTGIQGDAAAVLRAIDESGVAYEQVFLAATFAVRDAAGNDSEEEVMLASFDRETIERINWENFLATDVFELALNYNIAPALSE